MKIKYLLIIIGLLVITNLDAQINLQEIERARQEQLQREQQQQQAAEAQRRAAEEQRLREAQQQRELEAQRQREREEAYQNAIASAQRNFEQGQYALAKLEYLNALELRPENAATINQRIAIIDRRLAEVERQRAEEERVQNYRNAIASAERNFTLLNFTQARQDYLLALGLSPGSASYINPRLAELDGLIAEQNRQRAAEQRRQQVRQRNRNILMGVGLAAVVVLALIFGDGEGGTSR